MENKIGDYYYTENGLFVRLVQSLEVGKETKFIVIDEEEVETYDGEGTEIKEKAYIVSKLFEEVETTPSYLRQSKLDQDYANLYKIKQELEKEVQPLREEFKKLLQNTSSIFCPEFAVGQEVYWVGYREVVKTTIASIQFTLTKDGGAYRYLDKEATYIHLYATKEAADEELKQQLENKRVADEKYQLQRYGDAKKVIEEWEAKIKSKTP